MNKKGQWWIWTQVALWIIVLLIIVFGGTSLYKVNKLSKAMEEQTQQIVTTLGKTNTLLGKYEQMLPQIEEIKTRIGTLDIKYNELKLEADKLQKIQENLNKNEESLNNISINLMSLQNKYPPVQFQNIIFQNISKGEVDTFIQNAVNQRSWHLTFSFFFGSLIGISLSWVFFQFIYKKYIFKNDKSNIPKLSTTTYKIQ